MTADLPAQRRAFWAFYEARDPRILYGLDTNRLVPMTGDGAVALNLSLSQDRSSVFLRKGAQAKVDSARPFVTQHEQALWRALGVPMGSEAELAQGRTFRRDIKASFTLPSQWEVIATFFAAQRHRYAKAIAAIERVS